MTRFTATARRDGRWWVVQCDQHPGAISQVARLDQAASVHREAIAFVAGIPERDVEVVVTPAIPTDASEMVERSAKLRQAAAEQDVLAAHAIRHAAMQLRADGWSLRDIAYVLGISHQRVHQLVTAEGSLSAATV